MGTSIEWTDVTWNPVTGCDKVSAGCKNCYAEGVADRFFAKQYPPNEDGSPRKFTDVRCHSDRLEQPLHWKKPRRVFVNSMSDLFHDDVSDEFIGQVFAAMALSPQHTFQVLTKRPERMQSLVDSGVEGGFGCEVNERWHSYLANVPQARIGAKWDWPLPNVWLGVSVESQKYADERIPLLLQTPAAVRFLSVEPLLEKVDLQTNRNYLKGIQDGYQPPIDWVIVGGESGPGARPFNLSWAESLLKQCKAAEVPFFMKQLGSVPTWPEKNIAVMIPADRKGGDMASWPEHLRVREFPV